MAVRISIIIPAYNNGHYLKEALESVFAQTFDSYEVIVIDDGSTDNTQAILELFSSRIRYFYQEHTGVSSARNKGLALAKGEYVAFLDSDDIFFTDKLAKQIEILDANEDVGLVHSGWHLIDENKNVLIQKEPWHRAPKLDLSEWLIWQPIFLGAILFKRSWLEKSGGFNTNLSQAEDTDFLLRLAKIGCPCIWLKEPTVYYRQHTSGLTSRSMDRIDCVNKVIDDFFQSENLPESAKKSEKKVRYQILMWSVWQLYRNGQTDLIVDYLRKSLAFTSNSTKHIVHGWLLALISQCRSDYNYSSDELKNFWPYFEAALGEKDESLARTQQLFFWMLRSETKLKNTSESKFQSGVVQ